MFLFVWHSKQERREEKLDEKELLLRAKEEEVVHVRNTLYAQADEITALFVPFPSSLRPWLFDSFSALCSKWAVTSLNLKGSMRIVESTYSWHKLFFGWNSKFYKNRFGHYFKYLVSPPIIKVINPSVQVCESVNHIHHEVCESLWKYEMDLWIDIS